MTLVAEVANILLTISLRLPDLGDKRYFDKRVCAARLE